MPKLRKPNLTNKLSKFMPMLACASLFGGCAALDAPVHHYQTAQNCDVLNTTDSEAYHMRFEIVEDYAPGFPSEVHLETTEILEPGSESLVFSGDKAAIEAYKSQNSHYWVLASVGQNKEGNLCLKTRTATRPSDLEGNTARAYTLMNEEVFDIEMSSACGEAFIESELPGVENAKLRISSAPRSTADYLNNPETATHNSCSQLVDSLPPEQGNQFKSELRNALGV